MGHVYPIRRKGSVKTLAWPDLEKTFSYMTKQTAETNRQEIEGEVDVEGQTICRWTTVSQTNMQLDRNIQIDVNKD